MLTPGSGAPMCGDAESPRPGGREPWTQSSQSARPRRSRTSRPPRRTVTVHSDVPCYRLGLEHALADAGFEVLDPEPSAVARDGAIVTLDSQASHDLTAALARAGVTVLGLVSPADLKRCRDAVASGSSAVADFRAEPDEVVAMLIAAMRGVAVLPLAVLRSLALPDQGPAVGQMSAMEIDWLRLLARGATVAEVAITAHFSEREMFRRLKSVYSRFGTTERVPAIAAAIEAGVLR